MVIFRKGWGCRKKTGKGNIRGVFNGPLEQFRMPPTDQFPGLIAWLTMRCWPLSLWQFTGLKYFANRQTHTSNDIPSCHEWGCQRPEQHFWCSLDPNYLWKNIHTHKKITEIQVDTKCLTFPLCFKYSLCPLLQNIKNERGSLLSITEKRSQNHLSKLSLLCTQVPARFNIEWMIPNGFLILGKWGEMSVTTQKLGRNKKERNP